jgi:hypothetical protein
MYIWDELDDILIYGLLGLFYEELSTCKNQELEVEECSGALKFCYKWILPYSFLCCKT